MSSRVNAMNVHMVVANIIHGGAYARIWERLTCARNVRKGICESVLTFLCHDLVAGRCNIHTTPRSFRESLSQGSWWDKTPAEVLASMAHRLVTL